MFVNYQHREPPGYGRCIGCRRQLQARFLNDIGICCMCRMPVMLWPSNPLLRGTDGPY
jgi:hypothetical protein